MAITSPGHAEHRGSLIRDNRAQSTNREANRETRKHFLQPIAATHRECSLTAQLVDRGGPNERGWPGRFSRRLERVREAGFQELAQLRRRLELRNRLQLLESRREDIRETPDRS